MGVVTMVYTWFGGFKAVVWTDVLQLSVYLAGGVGALFIAWHLAGGADVALARAHEAGKLRLFDLEPSLTHTYTLLSGLVGGALLSGASHGADHLIVQRLLATRSLQDARVALVGSGVMVMLQFTLFLLVGSAIWAAGLAPAGTPSDQLFPAFVVDHLPVGLAGLVIAGILAAAMGTHSSAINSLASLGHPRSLRLVDRSPGPRSPAPGRPADLGGLGAGAHRRGALLPRLGGRRPDAGRGAGALDRVGDLRAAARHLLPRRAAGRARAAATWSARWRVTVVVMLVVVFAKRLVGARGSSGSAPVGRLAWPWYVPLGTLLAVGTGIAAQLSSGPNDTALFTGERTVTRYLIGADVGGTKTAVGVSRRRDGARAGRRRRRGGPARPGARVGHGHRRRGAAGAGRHRPAERRRARTSAPPAPGASPSATSCGRRSAPRTSPTTVVVSTDIEIALAAAFDEGPGIVVSAGTGSVAVGRDRAGRRQRIGGYGWQMGDEGSGYAIGRAALGAVSRAADGRSPRTALSERVLAATRSDDFDALVRWAAGASPAEVAALAPHVLDVAAHGDTLAQGIADYAARELTQLVLCLLPTLDVEPPVGVAVTGGLLSDGRPAPSKRAGAVQGGAGSPAGGRRRWTRCWGRSGWRRGKAPPLSSWRRGPRRRPAGCGECRRGSRSPAPAPARPRTGSR